MPDVLVSGTAPAGPPSRDPHRTARIGAESVHASFLGGCDGGVGPVRKALGIGYPGRSPGCGSWR
jgi:hypothetical protein